MGELDLEVYHKILLNCFMTLFEQQMNKSVSQNMKDPFVG